MLTLEKGGICEFLQNGAMVPKTMARTDRIIRGETHDEKQVTGQSNWQEDHSQTGEAEKSMTQKTAMECV